MNNVNEYNNYILKYLKNNNTNSALLISSPWGTGKSYYIKNNLQKFLLENHKIKCIIVSLFGVKDVDDLRKKIYLESKFGAFKKKNELTTQFYVQGKTIAKGLISKHWIDYIISDEDLKKIYKSINLKDKLLILEDFERTKIDIIELLGFINDLVFNDNLKVIIVANEDEIASNSIKEYYRVKEKTIFDTIHLQINYNDAIISIIKSFNNNQLYKLLELNSDAICDQVLQIMYEVDNYNLRALTFACEKTKDIFNYIQNVDYEFLEFSFMSIVAFSLRRNKNSKLKWNESNGSVILGTKTYPLLKCYYDYIEKQFIDETIIYKQQNLYIEKQRKEKMDTEVNIELNNLFNYHLKTENEVFKIIKNIEVYLKNNVIECSIYPKLSLYLIKLSRIFNCCHELDIINNCKAQILNNLKLINNKKEIYDLFKFNTMLNTDNTELNNEIASFINQMIDILNPEEDNFDLSINFFNDIKLNMREFKEMTISKQSFLYNIEINDLIQLILRSKPYEIEIIRVCFLSIYRDYNSYILYNNDLEKLEILKNGILEHLNSNLINDRIVNLQMEMLLNNLNEIINKIIRN